MTEYRRAWSFGGTWFFTVNLARRQENQIPGIVFVCCEMLFGVFGWGFPSECQPWWSCRTTFIAYGLSPTERIFRWQGIPGYRPSPAWRMRISPRFPAVSYVLSLLPCFSASAPLWWIFFFSSFQGSSLGMSTSMGSSPKFLRNAWHLYPEPVTSVLCNQRGVFLRDLRVLCGELFIITTLL